MQKSGDKGGLGASQARGARGGSVLKAAETLGHWILTARGALLSASIRRTAEGPAACQIVFA